MRLHGNKVEAYLFNEGKEERMSSPEQFGQMKCIDEEHGSQKVHSKEQMKTLAEFCVLAAHFSQACFISSDMNHSHSIVPGGLLVMS